MTLDKILKILDKEEATDVAGYGKSASSHWFAKGAKRKVPDFPALIAWADYLQLSDADLGELIRDAQRIRIEIFELLAKGGDKRRTNIRSNLRRSLAREIADELEERRNVDRAEQQELDKEKEHLLKKKQEQRKRIKERSARLDAYREQLEKIRRNNGDY
tara:strand:+ start:2799 stop:3278 length:480 start_codon:yes stop_codon:yes gene_type:complete